MSTIEHHQKLIDEWQPQVDSDLAKCEQLRASAQRHDRLGLVGLKAAVAGGVLAAVGVAVSLVLGHGNLGVWPGLAVFAVGLSVSSWCSIQRDAERMDYSSRHSTATHRQQLLQTRLVPGLAQAREALLRQDSEEMTRLAEGLRRAGSVLESPQAITLGGTRLRKRT